MRNRGASKRVVSDVWFGNSGLEEWSDIESAIFLWRTQRRFNFLLAAASVIRGMSDASNGNARRRFAESRVIAKFFFCGSARSLAFRFNSGIAACFLKKHRRRSAER